MAASHKSLSIPDLMYHSNQVDFDGMRKLCAELMPYEWSHMDEPMVWFEMVREQAVLEECCWLSRVPNPLRPC